MYMSNQNMIEYLYQRYTGIKLIILKKTETI